MDHTLTARHYRQQQIVNATPAQQIVMLYDAAIASCLKSQKAILDGAIEERHNANKKTMDVVSYLLDILDLEKGGDVAKRLHLIYTGILKQLMQVDFKNDAHICDSVVESLKVLRASWAQIAAQGTGSPQAQPATAPVQRLDRLDSDGEKPLPGSTHSAVA